MSFRLWLQRFFRHASHAPIRRRQKRTSSLAVERLEDRTVPSTITSTTTGGNWNTGSTWVGGVAPGASDTAVIATTGGNSVKITAGESVTSVTINSGATLENGPDETGTLTISGNLTITGTFAADSNPGNSDTLSVNLAGNFTDNGTFTAAGSTVFDRVIDVTMNGTSAQTISGTSTADFHNLTINNAAGVTLGSNIQDGVEGATAGTLTVDSGATFNMAAFTISNGSGGNGAFTLDSGGTLGIGSATGIASGTTASGNILATGTRTYSTGGNYTYNGAVNQATGTGLPATVNNLTIANTGTAGSDTVTLGGSITASGGLTLTSGILAAGANTINLNGSGGFTNNASTTALSAGTSTVSFGGTSAQSLGGTFATTFDNLTIADSGGVTLGTSSNPTVDGNLTLSSGTLTAGANTITLDGNWTNNSGTSAFAANTSTVVFAGTTGTSAQNIAGSAATTFDNLTINNSGTSNTIKNAVSPAASLAINGVLTMANSTTFNMNGSNLSAGLLSTSGSGTSVFIEDGVNTDTSTLTLNGSGSQTFAGVIEDGGNPNTHLSLAMSGTGTETLTGINTYTGTTAVNAGNTLYVDGSTVAGSTFTVASSSSSVLGGGKGVTAGTISGPITFSGSGTLSPGDGSNPTGILDTGALTLNSASTYAARINGTTAGSGYDKVVVTGTATLGGATLSLSSSGLTSVVGDTFTILSATLVSGTFAGGNGALFTANGVEFQVSYSSTAVTLTHIAPTVTAVSSTSSGDFTIGATIPITVTYNVPVTVTGTPQLTLNSGGTATYASGSPGTTLTFNYTVLAGQNSSDLDYTSTSALSLNSGTIKDGAGGSASLTLPATGSDGLAAKNIAIGTTAPTVNVTPSGTSTDNSPITFTLTFSESVTGLTAAGITVANGTKGTLSGSGSSYNLPVTPSASGVTVTLQVNASVAHDVFGNNNTASNTASVSYSTTAPTVSVTPSGTSTDSSPITFTLTFSESVTGLSAAGITVTNGTKGTLLGSGTTYTIPVTPSASGVTVTLQVNANAAQDVFGNENTASNTASVSYSTTAPTVNVTPSGTSTDSSPITFTLTFSESVTGLSAAGITVTNGTKGTLLGGGTTYTMPVTPSASGVTVTLQVNASAAQDVFGNENTASNTASVS